MADYKVTDTELTSVADAIRSKANSNASLSWPNGFVDGIAGIDTYQSMYEIVMTKIASSKFTFVDNSIFKIGDYAFYNVDRLQGVTANNVTIIEQRAFQGCSALSTVNVSAVSAVGQYAFSGCASLAAVSIPNARTIGSNAFYGCFMLSQITIHGLSVTGIQDYAFRSCYRLTSVTILDSSAVCQLGAYSVFSNTPIGGYIGVTNGVYGSVYVPSSLVSAYQSATNWVSISNRITSIPE